MAETGINFYYGEKTAWFCSSEIKMINQIKRLAKQHPKEVKILKNPEDNDGIIYCEFPKGWVKLRGPNKRQQTEEQKQAAAARLKKANKKS